MMAIVTRDGGDGTGAGERRDDEQVNDRNHRQYIGMVRALTGFREFATRTLPAGGAQVVCLPRGAPSCSFFWHRRLPIRGRGPPLRGFSGHGRTIRSSELPPEASLRPLARAGECGAARGRPSSNPPSRSKLAPRPTIVARFAVANCTELVPVLPRLGRIPGNGWRRQWTRKSANRGGDSSTCDEKASNLAGLQNGPFKSSKIPAPARRF
jgi:hypothetical protein